MQPAAFVSKHGFQGDIRQAQLSFGPGVTIIAKPNQDGAWWWGSCNGKEGWFPPSYVSPAPATQPASFLPVLPQGVQPVPPQQQYQQPIPPYAGIPSYAQTPPPPQPPADPFAGLENMGSTPPSRPPSLPSSPALTSAQPSSLPPKAAITPQARSTPVRSASGTKMQSFPTAASSGDSAAAALARMGISPPPSRAASPLPPRATPRSQPPSRASSPLPPSTPVATEASFATSSGEGMSSKVPTSKPPSAEEVKARQLREQEEARQKAKMRQEKEEMRKSARVNADVSTGLGTSGVTLTATEETIEVGLPPGSFNAFEYLSGSSKLPERKFRPIFRVPPFWNLMNLNTYVHQQPVPPELLKNRTAMYQQLTKSLSFMSHICAETMQIGVHNPLQFLQSNHWGCEACIRLIEILPHSAGASGAELDGLFMNFLNVLIPLLENVQDHQQLVLPGGWQQPDYTYLCLYIVRNCGNNRWSFTVCNTGHDGLQYHPATFDPETGTELKQLAMTVWDIPAARVLDSTFWTLLFRMQVYPSKKNNAAFLYTKLMPSLNARPLLSNMDQGPSEFLPVPNAISAQSYHPLARLALTSSPATGCRQAKYATLLVMNAALEMAYGEIESMPASSMDPEDTRILRLAGRNLANYASTISPTTVGDGTLGASLSATWDLLDKVLKKLNFCASKPMDQYSHGLPASAMKDNFSQGKIVSLATAPGSAAHPLFGRIRRDNYEVVVKALMGDPRPDPILIPAVLTDEKLPPVATDYSTAGSYLQRIADACSLLLQQRRLIKNAPAFAASAAQHALTTVLPMPNSDPKFCFWRQGSMRRETQLNLLFLVRRICRIYSAATACVQQSRGLIAIRSTAFAAAACVADAICRVVAVDDPSAFALHYSGLCEGPTEMFALEAGSFDTLGANLPIYNPTISSLRYECLEYLRNLTLRDDGSRRYSIFNFDKSMTPLRGDMILLDQLSIQLALQRPFPMTEEAMRNHSAALIGGKNGSLIEVLPEFEYFRDICFHFKHAVSGTDQTPTVPDSHTWVPSDATLHWNVVRRSEKDKEDTMLLYTVSAFRGHPQQFVAREAQQEQKNTKSAFSGFLQLFSGKSRIERSRLSSADPTTVVNSCGEKFLAKK